MLAFDHRFIFLYAAIGVLIVGIPWAIAAAGYRFGEHAARSHARTNIVNAYWQGVEDGRREGMQ